MSLQVAWEDQFESTTINQTIWEAEPQNQNYGDPAGQHMSNLNAAITDTQYVVISPASNPGMTGNTLKLIARSGSFPTGGPAPNPAPWKAGCIRSKPAYLWSVNQRLEGKCWVTNVVGPRPAFWARNLNGPAGNEDAEVDLMESYAKRNGQNNGGTVIWAYTPSTKQNVYDPQNSSGYGSHTWACDWLPDRFIFYRDGVAFRTVTQWASTFPAGGGGPPTFPEPFGSQTHQSVSLSNQIGGIYSSYSWTGAHPSEYTQPVAPGVTTVVFEFEYVTVYDIVADVPAQGTTYIGTVLRPATAAPADTPLWSEDFATTAADTTAFFGAYGTQWQPEPTTFNVGSGQMLQAVWNTDPANVVVSAATTGGTGNSLKLQAVRGDHTVPCAAGGTTTVPFSTGGINSRGNSGAGPDSGPFSVSMNSIVEVRMRFTTVRAGHRGMNALRSYTRNAEIDFPEFFSVAGNGGATGCTLSGIAAVTQARHHWMLLWEYSPTSRSVHSETAFADTNWHIYQLEWKDRSIKVFMDGQLMVHYGDPPLDGRAVFNGFDGASRLVPFKWGNAYQPNTGSAYVYPEPYTNANVSPLKLSLEVGGMWCQPIDPTAISAAAGTVVMGSEIDYVTVYNALTHGAL